MPRRSPTAARSSSRSRAGRRTRRRWRRAPIRSAWRSPPARTRVGELAEAAKPAAGGAEIRQVRRRPRLLLRRAVARTPRLQGRIARDRRSAARRDRADAALRLHVVRGRPTPTRCGRSKRAGCRRAPCSTSRRRADAKRRRGQGRGCEGRRADAERTPTLAPLAVMAGLVPAIHVFLRRLTRSSLHTNRASRDWRRG